MAIEAEDSGVPAKPSPKKGEKEHRFSGRMGVFHAGWTTGRQESYQSVCGKRKRQEGWKVKIKKRTEGIPLAN